MMLGYTSRVILAPNDNLTSMRIMTMLIVMMGTKTIVANCPWPARPPAWPEFVVPEPWPHLETAGFLK